jgi:hypothetical protein
LGETWGVYLKREFGDILKEWYLRIEERQGSIETPLEGFAILLKMPKNILFFKPLRSRWGNHHKFTIDPKKIDRNAEGCCGMVHTHPIHVYGATTDDAERISGIYPLTNPMSDVDKDNVLKREAIVEVVVFRSWNKIKLQAFGHIYKGDPNRFSTVSLGEAPLPKWLQKMIGVKPKVDEEDETTICVNC